MISATFVLGDHKAHFVEASLKYGTGVGNQFIIHQILFVHSHVVYILLKCQLTWFSLRLCAYNNETSGL